MVLIISDLSIFNYQKLFLLKIVLNFASLTIKHMLNIPSTHKQRVVIIGGGFAGIRLAQSLVKSNFQVVIIDKNNYHQFQPLFYQVATAGIEPSGILFPLRKLFQRKPDFILRIAEVTSVDTANNIVITNAGQCDYDFLVVAAGAKSSFFGMDELEKHAFPMKTVLESLALRNTILNNLEKALLETDDEKRETLLNLVIVGGGPTGTEVAGALAEMKNHIFPKEYPELDIESIRIVLVEASETLLGGMSKKSSSKAETYLKRLGVEVMTSTQVKGYHNNRVSLNNGQSIATSTLIWAAGIIGVMINGIDEKCYTPSGRLKVDEFNEVIGLKNVFALGDNCIMVTPQLPKGHPQVAQVAIQQAKNLGLNLKNRLKNKEPKPFKYRNFGSLATIGRHLAVADLPGVSFYGFFAWFVWMFVHLMAILGVKNRLFVFINWMWSYLTFDQSLRLIIQREDHPKE